MAYVANLFPYSGRKLSTAFISPIVPMEIRSSCSSSELTYFLRHGLPGACCATPVLPFAPCSPFLICTDSLFPLFLCQGNKNVFTQHLFQQLSNILCQQKAFCAFPFIFFLPVPVPVCAGSGFPLIRNVSFQYLILTNANVSFSPALPASVKDSGSVPRYPDGSDNAICRAYSNRVHSDRVFVFLVVFGCTDPVNKHFRHVAHRHFHSCHPRMFFPRFF